MLANTVRAASHSAAALRLQIRSISVGTDMISSAISLQKARPWLMSAEEGSNLAKDNAVTMKELFNGKVVAVFGVPAPFTGTCTNEHYPGYKAIADEIKAEGVHEIVCYAVSDPYAHHGWSRALKNDDSKITFLADPDSSFARAYGVDKVYDDASLGARSIRFSMIVNNGTVMNFRQVDDALNDAETLLEEVKDMNENLAA